MSAGFPGRLATTSPACHKRQLSLAYLLLGVLVALVVFRAPAAVVANSVVPHDRSLVYHSSIDAGPGYSSDPTVCPCALPLPPSSPQFANSILFGADGFWDVPSPPSARPVVLLAGASQPEADEPPEMRTGPLSWMNVAIASGLMVIDGIISIVMGLHLENTLLVSAVRCLVQLTIMGFLLEDVFATRNPLLVLAMSSFLIIMATYETVFSKCKRRHTGMVFSVLSSLCISTIAVSSIGGMYALNARPFWYPYKFIPTLGMLLGNCMTGTALGLNTCLTSATENKERIESYLSMGASRWEAVRPVAIEAIRNAMLPTLNNMSIMGLISIPGMMTGQILGGVPVLDAVKYQQIIMFMIAASTAMGSLAAVLICLHTVIDKTHRLRLDRIYVSGSLLMRERKGLKRTTRFFFGAGSSPVSSSSDELCTAEFDRKQRTAASPPPSRWFGSRLGSALKLAFWDYPRQRWSGLSRGRWARRHTDQGDEGCGSEVNERSRLVV